MIDADCLRLKNILLGYNIPKPILERIGLSDLKIYAQGENLLTVFGAEGIDPEQTTVLKFPNNTDFTANSPYYLFAIPELETINNPNL